MHRSSLLVLVDAVQSSGEVSRADECEGASLAQEEAITGDLLFAISAYERAAEDEVEQLPP